MYYILYKYYVLSRMAAKNILQVAERVEKALAESQEIHKNVDKGILKTKESIADATNSLTKVSPTFLWVTKINRLSRNIISIVIRDNNYYNI